MDYAFNKNARMTWVVNINSFPCLFISSSAFNCCGENFQNILFHSLHLYNTYNGILLPKLFWPTVRKNYSSDREKFLKSEAEGREFAIFWDH